MGENLPGKNIMLPVETRYLKKMWLATSSKSTFTADSRENAEARAEADNEARVFDGLPPLSWTFEEKTLPAFKRVWPQGRGRPRH